MDSHSMRLLSLPKSEKCIKHCYSVEDVKAKTAELLKRVTSDKIQNFFEQWKAPIQWYIDREEEFVERNKSVVTLVSINHIFLVI